MYQLKYIKYSLLLIGLLLMIACGGSIEKETVLEENINMSDNTIEEAVRKYGVKGKYTVAKPWEEPEHNMSAIYYPENIAQIAPTPVVLFVPAWKSTNHKDYASLLKFIASHGYTVIYAKDNSGAYASEHLLKHFITMARHSEVSSYIDTQNIGIIGHSSGGGHAFKILQDCVAVNKWGTKSTFLFTMDPWFAFDMNKTDMQTLDTHTNVLFMQFGKAGHSPSSSTDTRIPLSQFYLLDSIPNNQKDYQIFENATHSYPFGERPYAQMQGILKPLDALMEYTFSKQSRQAHKVALEMGSDDPYNNGAGIQLVLDQDKYQYRCDGNDNSAAIHTLKKRDIDYCAIKGN